MRPYILINVAVSADGKLDTFERKGSGISSTVDKARVLRLRAESDAIMVGGKTLLAEDPKLTVKDSLLIQERIARGQPANPIKVGVVTQAAVNPIGDFMSAGPARRVIFTTQQTSSAQIKTLVSHGAEVYVCGENRVQLPEAMQILYDLGVRQLMVEGGGSLNFELLRINLVDEISMYLAPKIFGGWNAPSLADGAGLVESSALKLKLIEARVLDDDGGLLIRYQLLN